MNHQQAVDTMASERYLLDEMTEDERDRFETHFFDCADCAEDVRTGALIRQEVKAGALDSAIPTRQQPQQGRVIRRDVPRWRRPMVALPWAAAAALGGVAAYQSLVTIPELRTLDQAQALTPVMLRGATRGADPVVTVAPGQTFVTLSSDVDAGADTRELAYTLLTSSGTAVISGRAPAPPAGVPLMLLVPTTTVAQPGRYTLVVRDAARPDAALGEYNFTVSN